MQSSPTITPPLPSTMRQLQTRSDPAASAARLCLLVIGDDRFSTRSVPEHGQLSVGRDADCDVSIDDPSVSRRHAMLHLGATPSIEDLGSANGVRVRGARIPVGERIPFAVGEVVDAGGVMMILQPRAAPARPRRIWAHGYFDARLEEEAARAERDGSNFAVLFVVCDGRDATAHEDALTEVLRPSDVVGRYARGTFEVLLVDTSPEVAEQVRDRLQARLALAAKRVDLGLACYPRDGRDPDSIAAAARNAVRRPRVEIPETSDAPMQSLHRLVERIARSHISVLIGGETGVGKEVLAETIHRLSPRRDRPFLRLNCAALSETLLESELFGHERGAFTGATHAKIGLLETAQGGTVFLDEVGELPLSTQVKLLRVLEERHVLPVGALKARSIDVRFIAATNRDLEAEVSRRTFRQDLYFRLNAVSLVIPPLRDRVGEIDGLVQTFVKRASREANRERAHKVSEVAMQMLKAYAWPGNIRELRNVMERAVVLAEDDDVITQEHLPVEKLIAVLPHRPSAAKIEVVTNHDEDDDVDPVPAPSTDASLSSVERLRQAVLDEERTRIIDALNACAGNQTRAAERLGIARRTLVKRLRKLGVPRPRKG